MPAAFVTGGTGFVGWHVAKTLLAEGWTVRALARGAPSRRSGLEDLSVEIVAGDLASAGDFGRALAGCDAVIHAAGLLKARALADYRAVNVSGTERILAAASAACPDATFVYVSSQAAAGPARDGRPVAEGDAAKPVSWYGISKLEGEQAIARDWKGRWVVVRPGVLYGPRDRGLLTYFRMAARGFVPVPAASTRIQAGAVEETALGIVRAASRRDLAGRIGFLCDPRPLTVREFASAIAAAANRPVRLIEIPDAAVRIAGALESLRERLTGASRPFNADKAREILAGDWLCDPAPLRRDLGLPNPPPLEDGLRAAWNWYRANGWIAS
jgi:nucleoside-diphosphate-sugar epimerase